jgi:hypothetical protein
VLLVAASSFLFLWSASPPSSAARSFEVFFRPPGLILRGEPVTLFSFADQSGGASPRGDVYLRAAAGGPFTRVRLVWDVVNQVLRARVPAASLEGSVLDSYVVVRDPASGETVTIPPRGADAPYRSWIIDPPTLRLPKHVFGHPRSPDAVVARAPEGSGPHEVGVSCTGVNECAGPPSFDVAPDGTVWVADTLNGRLLAWTPGHPRGPTRTIRLDVTPSDLAIGTDGRIYLSGCCAPDQFHNVLRALTPGGRMLWDAPLLGEIYNDQIRVGSDGLVFTRTPSTGGRRRRTATAPR